MKLLHTLVLLILLVAIAVGAYLAFRNSAPDWDEEWPEPPNNAPGDNSTEIPPPLHNDADNGTVDPPATERRPLVRFETTMGDIVIELWEDEMPWSVANFVDLSERGIYDDTWFHRIIDGFMIQGGDPGSAGVDALPDDIGEGDAGVTWRDESNGDRKFDRKGLLAMANAGKDTNGSQFFITLAETPWLNSGGERGYHHNIFGEVIEGMEMVEAIGKVAIDAENGHRPLEMVGIVRAIVEYKRDRAYELPPEAIVETPEDPDDGDNGDGDGNDDGDGGGGE